MLHVSLGAHPFALPAPVFLVGVYDANRRPNVMTAAWGGICASHPPSLAVSIRPATWTHKTLREKDDFTISIPSAAQVAQADLAGMVSGERENKFEALGMTPRAGEHVDAPYVAECPVVMELSVRFRLELGSHTQFVGEIMDVKVREDCLRDDRAPDPAKIQALLFSPLTKEYYATGSLVARAFAVGRTLAGR